MSGVIPLLPLYYNGVDRNDYAIELEPLTALLNKPQLTKQTTDLRSALPLIVQTNLQNICEIYN